MSTKKDRQPDQFTIIVLLLCIRCFLCSGFSVSIDLRQQLLCLRLCHPEINIAVIMHNFHDKSQHTSFTRALLGIKYKYRLWNISIFQTLRYRILCDTARIRSAVTWHEMAIRFREDAIVYSLGQDFVQRAARVNSCAATLQQWAEMSEFASPQMADLGLGPLRTALSRTIRVATTTLNKWTPSSVIQHRVDTVRALREQCPKQYPFCILMSGMVFSHRSGNTQQSRKRLPSQWAVLARRNSTHFTKGFRFHKLIAFKLGWEGRKWSIMNFVVSNTSANTNF